MGRQRDSKLVGTASNLIFYNFRGEYCIRTKPVSVRRNESSVHSGLNFGKASKICRQIRNLVAPINPAKSDNRVMYKLTGALNQFISWKEKKDKASVKMSDKLPFIYGFQFNDQADLTSIHSIKASVKLTEQGMTEISLAPFISSKSLHAPTNTIRIVFKMMLLCIHLKDAKTELLGKSEIEIPYSDETFQPPVISMPSLTKSSDLVILVMEVQYMVYKNGNAELLNDKRKMPCGVAWAVFI
jgi:hypothetical protein